MSEDVFLDARGLACPMPLLKLKQQLNRMLPGQSVCMEATDAGSVADVQSFCRQAGHGLAFDEREAESGMIYCFRVTRNAGKEGA